MTRPLRILLTFAVLLGGCGRPMASDEPPPVHPPTGSYAITLSDLVPPFVAVGNAVREAPPAPPGAVATLLGAALELAPTGHQTVLRIDDRVYIGVEFLATNRTDTPLERLALLALGVPGARSGSALSAIRLGNAQAASDPFALSIHPTHALHLVEGAGGRRLLGRDGASDFVALAEHELPTPSSTGDATPRFPYGFWIGAGRPIAPGGHARVTLAFTFPAGAEPHTSLERFTWHAVLVQLPALRSVQAPQERHASGWAATAARARGMGGAQIVALGAGERSVPSGASCSDLIPLANVRIAGTGPSDPHHRTLLPARSDQPATFSGCPGANR
jgi:hypothetical protein